MSSWMTPKRPQEQEQPETPPDLPDRILAAVVAPVAFNLAIWIVYAGLFRYTRGPVAFAAAFANAQFAIPVLAVSLVVPVVFGFAFGTRRVITFLGHSFYTNHPKERDWRITVAIWATICGLAFLLTR